ncbi:MAG: oprM-A [Parachlamydiales bacterium]|nr:oprM-A [Parachlamydiales bacterium]
MRPLRLIPLIMLAIAGCTVGPKYLPPDNTVGDAWHEKGNEESIEPTVTAWWSQFHDPLLNKYIEMAACNNKDLARAEAAILQARALRDIAASRLFPQITSDLSAVKTYFSKNGPVFAVSPGGGQGGGISSATTGLPFQAQVPQVQNLYNALFDATWEIDLFGKTRRTVESAEARVESAIEQRNDTLVTVLAEVARNYMELRGFQKHAWYLEENIRLLEQTEQVVNDQLAAGLANQINCENTRALLSDARAALPDIIADIYRSIYTLSLLTGQMPEELVDELIVKQELPALPDIVAVGLRSDLLRRRPDVRKAERELAAATADVGVAVASFYPTFSLLGDAGLQSLQIKNLFQSASKTWAYGGDFNVPIYEGGKRVGNLHAFEAAQTMALSSYQQTVLAALQNTESALVAYSESLATRRRHEETVQHLEKVECITRERFEKGLIGVLDWINSQIQLISAEETLLKNQSASLIDLVALYKALGGGWEPQDQFPTKGPVQE